MTYYILDAKSYAGICNSDHSLSLHFAEGLDDALIAKSQAGPLRI